jgi:ATP-binding cassette subfamily B protein
MMLAVAMVIFVPRAAASGSRLMQVLATQPSIADPAEPVLARTSDGTIEFREVRFGYPGGEKPVLCDLSFEVRPGLTTAIIGSTGSGKTTVLNLIPRFFDVTAGAVFVNGVDVREQKLESLWASMGLIPQQAYLFRGTIAENLRFGNREATDEDLWHALEVAQARDFVTALPEKLNASVDQGGTNFSGGQKQRLAIARALVKRPKIYLFDDAFSALDAGTDARLRAALKREARGATVLIVAQRVSTILNADQIVVLDEGRIVGIGSHDELMEATAQYREIVTSQLGEEAVA